MTPAASLAPVTRRQALRTGLAAAGAACFAPLDAFAARITAAACDTWQAPGELLGLLPLSPERGQARPIGTPYGGDGLDGRLLYDLASLEPDRLVTPTDRFFIRTMHPAEVAARQAPWRIEVGGLTRTRTLPIEDVMRDAVPMGTHLAECSGNANPKDFGFLSVAEWDGVPLAPLIDSLGPGPGATAVMVTGVDHAVSESGRSVPTASWVYPLDGLDRLGAFLAVRMNGEPLPLDHGRPVRMAIPGWYGCTWIKWVREIRFVGPDEPSTPQMREFAARTHQDGTPELARDYAPAEIDLTGTVTRVEKRRVDGRVEYRLVGIVWGGTRRVTGMRIGFGNDQWEPLAVCPSATAPHTWSMWQHRWRPSAPGLYDIALRSADPSIRTRRLDRGFYVRQVRIDEV